MTAAQTVPQSRRRSLASLRGQHLHTHLELAEARARAAQLRHLHRRLLHIPRLLLQQLRLCSA